MDLKLAEFYKQEPTQTQDQPAAAFHWLKNGIKMLSVYGNVCGINDVHRSQHQMFGKLQDVRQQTSNRLTQLQQIISGQQPLAGSCTELEDDIVKCSIDDEHSSRYLHSYLPRDGESVLTQSEAEYNFDKASTIRDKLTCLEVCLKRSKSDPYACDPMALAYRAIPLFRVAEANHPERVKALREELQFRLERSHQELNSTMARVELELISTVRECCRGQTVAKASDLVKTMDDRLMELAVKEPSVIPQILSENFVHSEPDFFKLMELVSLGLDKQVEYIVKNMHFNPRRASVFVRAILNQPHNSRDKKNLESLIKNTTDPFFPFYKLIHFASGNKNCEPFIKKIVQDSRTKDVDKANLLRLAVALELISNRQAKVLVKKLPSGIVETALLKVELCTAQEELDTVLQAEINAFDSEGLCHRASSETDLAIKKKLLAELGLTIFKSRCLTHTAALKSLEFGDVDNASEALDSLAGDDKTKVEHSPYEMAMMQWCHGLKPARGNKSIPDGLAEVAVRGDVKAQCRLMDWVLTEKVSDPQLRTRSYCYVAAPMVNNTVERDFYKGVAAYHGVGCEADLSAGLKAMQGALDCESPIPALRLGCLHEKGCQFPDELNKAYALELLTSKCAVVTPSLQQEMLFSLGVEQLFSLAVALKEHAPERSPEKAPQMIALANILESLASGCIAETDLVLKQLIPAAPVKSPEELLLGSLQTLESMAETQRDSSEVAEHLLQLQQREKGKVPRFKPHNEVCQRLIKAIDPSTPEMITLLHQLYRSMNVEHPCTVVSDRMMQIYLGEPGLKSLPAEAASKIVFEFVEPFPDEHLLPEVTVNQFRTLGGYIQPSDKLSTRCLGFMVHFGNMEVLKKQWLFSLKQLGAPEVCKLIELNPHKVGESLFVQAEQCKAERFALFKQLPADLVRLLEPYIEQSDLVDSLMAKLDTGSWSREDAFAEFRAFMSGESTLSQRDVLSLHERLRFFNEHHRAALLAQRLKDITPSNGSDRILDNVEWLKGKAVQLLYPSPHPNAVCRVVEAPDCPSNEKTAVELMEQKVGEISSIEDDSPDFDPGNVEKHEGHLAGNEAISRSSDGSAKAKEKASR